MRMVPRRHRFDCALSFASLAVPILRWTGAYHEQEIKQFHRPHEIALHLLLNALSKNGTSFDLITDVNGLHNVVQSLSSGKGVLLIGHHAALTVLMVRILFDKGLAPIVITPDDRLRVPGTLIPARTLQPSVMFLVKLRGNLKRRELVCGMPDRAEHHEQRTIEFKTATGQVIFAPAMISVAVRSGAQVLFTEVHVEGRRLVATVVAPSPATSADVETIVDDFVSFVQEQTCRHSGRNTRSQSIRSNNSASASPGM
jgi:lauroyl/myristoyl acyltransferase